MYIYLYFSIVRAYIEIVYIMSFRVVFVGQGRNYISSSGHIHRVVYIYLIYLYRIYIRAKQSGLNRFIHEHINYVFVCKYNIYKQTSKATTPQHKFCSSLKYRYIEIYALLFILCISYRRQAPELFGWAQCVNEVRNYYTSLHAIYFFMSYIFTVQLQSYLENIQIDHHIICKPLSPG